jgi:hypothetical protein
MSSTRRAAIWVRSGGGGGGGNWEALASTAFGGWTVAGGAFGRMDDEIPRGGGVLGLTIGCGGGDDVDAGPSIVTDVCDMDERRGNHHPGYT